jgi:hypothetical protein
LILSESLYSVFWISLPVNSIKMLKTAFHPVFFG